jgi:transposase
VFNNQREKSLSYCRYKAERRGRQVVEIDPWFPGRQTCSGCGALHPEMRSLSARVLVCDCGLRLGRDRNAAVNHWRYPEETGNRGACTPTCVEIGGCRGASPVPVEEARTLIDVGHDHKSQ